MRENENRFRQTVNRIPPHKVSKIAASLGSLNPTVLSECCGFASKYHQAVFDNIEKSGAPYADTFLAKNAYALCLEIECSLSKASKSSGEENHAVPFTMFLKDALENAPTDGLMHKFKRLMDYRNAEGHQLCHEIANFYKVASSITSLTPDTDDLFADLLKWESSTKLKWIRAVYIGTKGCTDGDGSMKDMVKHLPPHVVSKLASNAGDARLVCMEDCYAVVSPKYEKYLADACNYRKPSYAERAFHLCMGIESQIQKSFQNSKVVEFPTFIRSAICCGKQNSVGRKYRELMMCSRESGNVRYRQIANLFTLAKRYTDCVPNTDELFKDVLYWNESVRDKWSRKLYLGETEEGEEESA